MTDSYDDIIDLPHHVSPIRPRMPLLDRAAQFSPFAALTGYDAAVRETARLTEQRPVLDENEISVLNDKLQIVADRLSELPEITVTFFQPDGRKKGGACVTISGPVKRIDEYARSVVMADGSAIPIDDITGIDGDIFEILD